jgi:hypothetical protein
MSNEEIDAIVAALRAGDERTFWGDEHGDPWGGYSRWGAIYGFEAEAKRFYRRSVERTWHMGEGSPSERHYLDEGEARSALEAELREQERLQPKAK